MSALCIQCSKEFATNKEFEEHKASGHMTGGKSLYDSGIPPKVAPTAEFLEAIQRIEDKAKEKPEAPTIVTPVVAPAPVVNKPIQLVYKFEGTCPTCHKEVDTIEFEGGVKYLLAAFCTNCKKTLQSRQVKKL